MRQDVKSVDSATGNPAKVIGEQDLVLYVRAPFVSRTAPWRNREIEGIVPYAPAVADDVLGPNSRDVGEVAIVRQVLEREEDRQPVETQTEETVRVAVQRIDEKIQSQGSSAVVHLPVTQHRAALEVEGTDSRMTDSASARCATFKNELVTVREVIVDPRVGLRLHCPLVEVGGVRRTESVVDSASRTNHRPLTGGAGRHLVCPPVVDRLGVRCIHEPLQSDLRPRA